MAQPTRNERIEGGLLGLLVGDALGVPYEFHRPDVLPPLDQLEFTPPSTFPRSHASVPPGTWSDDGAQALALLASLVERGHFDSHDFGARLVSWYTRGELAVDGRVFDIGIQTAQAIRAIQAGVPAGQAGATDEQANGNGSLMRVLPLALWHRGDDTSLVAIAHAQSRVTHGHLRSQVCCAAYCLWARRTLEGIADAWDAAAASLRSIYVPGSAERAEFETYIRPDELPQGRGTGYVVDCLQSARQVQSAGSYEKVVKAAVALGHDTDTTACVAGGIAGLRDGVQGIPIRWREALHGQELLAPLQEALLQRYS